MDRRPASPAQVVVSLDCENRFECGSWFTDEGAAPEKVISGVQRRVKDFAGMNRLQQVARKVIANNLPVEEIEGLHNMFKGLDADRSGNISAEELREAFKGQSSKMPVEEFEKIIKVAESLIEAFDDVTRPLIWITTAPSVIANSWRPLCRRPM